MDIHQKNHPCTRTLNPEEAHGGMDTLPKKSRTSSNIVKKTLLTTLKTVLPELGKDGRFQEWDRLACNKAMWEESFNMYLTKI